MRMLMGAAVGLVLSVGLAAWAGGTDADGRQEVSIFGRGKPPLVNDAGELSVTGTLTVTPPAVQAVQGLDGGYPVAVTGTFTATFPDSMAVEQNATSTPWLVDFASHTQFSEGEVVCGTSTAADIPALTGQRAALIQNQGAQYVRIGLAPTASFGARVAPGASTGSEDSAPLKCISESAVESSTVYYRLSR
jgi:hypothetical protein